MLRNPDVRGAKIDILGCFCKINQTLRVKFGDFLPTFIVIPRLNTKTHLISVM